jgi:hypothetical protein
MLMALAALALGLTHVLPPILEAKMWALDTIGWSEYNCMSAIIEKESGWRVTARNRTSGAYGLFQAYPASKLHDRSPMGQMRWGIAYAERRYGSMCEAWAFWQRGRWW